MSKRTIKKLIGRGYLEEAIELMLELVEKYANGSDVENTLYNISGQYYTNESGKRGSTLTTEAYNTARNRLNGNLSDILDDSFHEIDESDIPDNYKQLLKSSSSSPVQEGSNDDTKPDNSANTKEDAETPATIADTGIVLFLSANPSKTALLNLKTEHSEIARELQNSSLKIISEEAVSFAEFSKAVWSKVNKPRIVHFSGHGDLEAPEIKEAYRARGIGKTKKDEKENEPGIILFDDSKRNSQFVESSALKSVFSLAKKLKAPLEAIVFNACHSEGQAKAVSEIGVAVVGTSSSVGDKAAIAFSTGFYFGLAEGNDLVDCFMQGRTMAMIHNEPIDRFTLYKDGEKVKVDS